MVLEPPIHTTTFSTEPTVKLQIQVRFIETSGLRGVVAGRSGVSGVSGFGGTWVYGAETSERFGLFLIIKNTDNQMEEVPLHRVQESLSLGVIKTAR